MVETSSLDEAHFLEGERRAAKQFAQREATLDVNQNRH
jgi:hypothetical protein